MNTDVIKTETIKTESAQSIAEEIINGVKHPEHKSYRLSDEPLAISRDEQERLILRACYDYLCIKERINLGAVLDISAIGFLGPMIEKKAYMQGILAAYGLYMDIELDNILSIKSSITKRLVMCVNVDMQCNDTIKDLWQQRQQLLDFKSRSLRAS